MRLFRDKLESRVRPYRQTHTDKITLIYYYNKKTFVFSFYNNELNTIALFLI